jgi:hypothetical protein
MSCSINNNLKKINYEDKFLEGYNNFILDDYNKLDNIYDKYLYCITKIKNAEKCKNIINNYR